MTQSTTRRRITEDNSSRVNGKFIFHILKDIYIVNYIAAVFFLSFFTAIISTSILSHTIRFHLFISTYVVKLVAGTVL